MVGAASVGNAVTCGCVCVRVCVSMSVAQVGKALKELVELEASTMKQQAAFQAAEEALAEDASAKVLLHRIVQHFRRLFDVDSLAGMFPKMNEVYLFVNEAQNFMAVLKQMLGLDQSAGTNACLSTLRRALEDDARRPEARAAPLTRTTFDNTVLGDAPAAPGMVPLRTGQAPAPPRPQQVFGGRQPAPHDQQRRDVWGLQGPHAGTHAGGAASARKHAPRGGDGGPEYVSLGASTQQQGGANSRGGPRTTVAAANVKQRAGGIGWTVA